MKQCRANPWEDFASTVKRGDRVKGPIKSITDFGVFLGLASGIDGLVHLSDLSWTEPGEAAVRNFKKGQEVEAVVLAIDVERERISLGIKQLDDDSFTTFTSMNDKGQIVTGKVKSVDAKGAEIDLGDDLVGYLRASEISAERVEDAYGHAFTRPANQKSELEELAKAFNFYFDYFNESCEGYEKLALYYPTSLNTTNYKRKAVISRSSTSSYGESYFTLYIRVPHISIAALCQCLKYGYIEDRSKQAKICDSLKFALYCKLAYYTVVHPSTIKAQVSGWKKN